MRVTFYIQRRILVAILITAALAFPLGALASHHFEDVPTSSTFHADIAAIRDAGVTTGCAVGLYCPKDFVTREQMAAFLNRLGALGPGKTPVVNADKLDGVDAEGLTRVAYGKEIDTSEPIPDASGWMSYGHVQLIAPTAGYVLVSSTVTLANNGCTANCEVYARMGHNQKFVEGVVAHASVVFAHDTVSTTTVFQVDAGSNTFAVRLSRDPAGNGNIHGYRAEITALFSPFSGDPQS